MKTSKKRFCSIAVAFLVSIFSLSALDWGGILKNNTKALLPTFSEFGISQTDDLYLWLNTPLGNSNFYFYTEGLYEFNYSNVYGTSSLSVILDLDLFKFAGDIEFDNSNILSISLGRFAVSDAGAIIFSQNIDGLFIKYQTGFMNISAFGGYTGLLNAQTVTMLTSDALPYAKESALYSLANPFIPFNATIEFPSLFGNQSLNFQVNGVVDLGEYSSSRYYATLWLTGPVTNTIFYNVSTIFGTKDFSSLMNYSSFDLYIYPTNMFFFSAGVEYASGNNGPFSPFVGVTTRTLVNSLSAPETSAALLPKLSATFISNKVSLSLLGKFYMACPSSFEAQGVEADLLFSYIVFTDFQLGLDINSYFDITEQKDNNNLSATLRVAISF